MHPEGREYIQAIALFPGLYRAWKQGFTGSSKTCHKSCWHAWKRGCRGYCRIFAIL